MNNIVAAGWLALGLGLSTCQTQKPVLDARPMLDASRPIWKSDAYTLYPDRVVQGQFEAKALSPTELKSNYRSPANAFQSPEITFKFALNGQDNEMAPGQDHKVLALPRAGSTTAETPLLVFGQQYVDKTPMPANTYLAANQPLRIRLDMRTVLKAFKEQGFFTTYKGDKIFRQDFKGVFVAGMPAPLSWDFDNLYHKPEFELKDADGDGIYEITLTLNAPADAKTTATEWKKSLNTDDLPQYSSDYPLSDALYNLALEEARRAVEPDGTFRTGKEWAGVWTRDISYSIILAQAALQPKVAMTSLLRKVSANGRIIQDTGTGGAYPCSTDRTIWAVAAWEIYKVTGDENWLRTVYPVIKKSLEDDAQNAYDPVTGLVRGESSFLDWREQTYPRWMQPADIYQSENLGTNAVHYQANVVLASMAERLGEAAVATRHRQAATQIQQGINRYLWQEGQGYYAQYRYGRAHQTLSPRSETLGEALCVLFGVADAERAKTVVQMTPTVAFGAPCIYPQIPGIPPYHNNAVWPFVQSYWALAAAQTGNENSVMESIAAIYRPAALFLTNKENFVAENGDYAGTQVNSSNMLWSLSGSLGLVYKVLFGMQFEAEQLVFRPFVPQALQGTRKLTNFRYRGAVLDVAMTGFGHAIKTITLDGQPLAGAAMPASLTGRHQVQIVLTNTAPAEQIVNRVANIVTPETPVVQVQGDRLVWPPCAGATSYLILKNGKPSTPFDNNSWPLDLPADRGHYQVMAVNAQGVESFASEPLIIGKPTTVQVPLEAMTPKSPLPYQGFTGAGFIEISSTQNRRLTIPVKIAEAGTYALDFRYANGNGPVNTENKCAIRTLRLGEQQVGTVVLPQRGVGEWSNWGFSNPVLVRLAPGTHTFQLNFEPANENMNGAVNQAMLDYLRATRVE
ncbi:trehalase family glycosidase [Hymenobacter sp. ASUV-10]|uniref:Trehalase family glycosidase n=1 Tax=Hymenobacter aranciens TaxID=3063996 RepID=A0ABT9B8Z1_9BACT|nr:trehalase family glycosidase [Hymenobacter sp. ASUV-10]MDO7874133.1 trehalase family glycosidase [Hymenobacter sp. ASUV-10]